MKNSKNKTQKQTFRQTVKTTIVLQCTSRTPICYDLVSKDWRKQAQSILQWRTKTHYQIKAYFYRKKCLRSFMLNGSFSDYTSLIASNVQKVMPRCTVKLRCLARLYIGITKVFRSGTCTYNGIRKANMSINYQKIEPTSYYLTVFRVLQHKLNPCQ